MNLTSAFGPCARACRQAAEAQITAITNANTGRFIAILRVVELRCGVAMGCDAQGARPVVSLNRQPRPGRFWFCLVTAQRGAPAQRHPSPPSRASNHKLGLHLLAALLWISLFPLLTS